MDATVIEDILEGIGNVPNALKRNMELMRELDCRVAGLLTEVAEAEAEVKTRVKNLSPSSKSVAAALGVDGREALKVIAKKRRVCDDLCDEKIAIAEQTLSMVVGHVDTVTTELSVLSAHLHATGEFESGGSARPGDEVAMKLDDQDCWILARVTKFKAETSVYEVCDADDERKTYQLPEARVVPLGPASSSNAATETSLRGSVAAPHALAPVASVLALDNAGAEIKLNKGDEVFAIYPDTTSFYSAVVSIPPRRSVGNNAICHVHFNDDADETGVTPDRPVALKYILRNVI